jgi:hypothetical protein
MTIVLISIIAILIIYFIVALSPPKVCAICTAVSLTWLGLLIGYLLGWHNEIAWVGILMGGSVVGLMYKLDNYWQKNNYSGTWLLKLTIVVFGFWLVYVIIIQEWRNLAWLAPLAVIVGAVGTILLRSHATKKHVPSKLQHKLDHCCD